MKRRRWMAIPGALVAVTLTLAACVTAKINLPVAPVTAGSTVTIQTTPVPLDPTDPARTAIGDFRYAGGVALTSAQTSRLHGLSGLVVGTDGRLSAVSDDGDFLIARLVLNGDETLAGLSHGGLFPLTGLDGKPLQGKDWGDAEGMAQPIGGGMLVSFEHRHRIWIYPGTDEDSPAPAPMPDVAMADNDGMEGLAAALDGYWVGIEPGSIWFCRLQATCGEVAGLPRPPAGFRLSGLATGPNGELVILHHSYVPAIGSRIIVTVVADPAGAKRVVGRFAMGPNTTTDNFEGIAVVARANGDWRFYLLSDDNFSASQRTLLLAFDWTPPR